eukprot:7099783-Prymnesium_polylepis.1
MISLLRRVSNTCASPTNPTLVPIRSRDESDESRTLLADATAFPPSIIEVCGTADRASVSEAIKRSSASVATLQESGAVARERQAANPPCPSQLSDGSARRHVNNAHRARAR